MKINPLTKKDMVLIKRAVRYIKPYKAIFSLAFLCVLSGIVFGLANPLLWAKVLTGLFQKDYSMLASAVLYMSVVFILQVSVSFLQNYLFNSLSESIIYDIKNDLYHRILGLPVKAFDEMRVGEFISRLNGDASAIAGIITQQFISTIVDVLKVIVIGIFVFSISIPLGLIVLCAFPPMLITFIWAGKKIREKNEKIATMSDSYFSNIQETISGIREVKSLGITQKKFDEFLSWCRKLKSSRVSIGILNSFSASTSQVIQFSVQVILVLVGFLYIMKGSLSVEHFIAFTAYSEQFSSSLMDLTRLNSSIQQMMVSLERIFGLMDHLNYSREEYGNKNIEEVEGNVRFENVYFNYTNGVTVLKGISFQVPNRKKIAIVGASGGGKTTLFNLLLRFYGSSSGRIFIDDTDIMDISEESLRKHIAVVMQDTFLFNTTILENLLMANPKATVREIEEACSKAYIHDFIMSLPDGYHSFVGERGVNLSIGQKQRISIARALLKNSQIILFDEATSSLDNESQYNIKKAIDELSGNHTVIMIAHRLLTIIEADEIIVIEDGEIVGQGTHGMLIKKNETYKRLYRDEVMLLTKHGGA